MYDCPEITVDQWENNRASRTSSRRSVSPGRPRRASNQAMFAGEDADGGLDNDETPSTSASSDEDMKIWLRGSSKNKLKRLKGISSNSKVDFSENHDPVCSEAIADSEAVP